MSEFWSSVLELIRADNLSWVMAGLIVFVVSNVLVFSSRYMAGDRNWGLQRRLILLLGGCVVVMVFADHLALLLLGWTTSNLLLVRLMIHKPEWKAARNSGWLAIRVFSLGFVFLGAGFWLLAESAGTASIHAIHSIHTARPDAGAATSAGLFLIAFAAMTQSAIWPFHRWLTSSLNSPTPVSALMHAGLVNGGGFILVRFAPLLINESYLLHVLFVAGLITAATGTLWKLVQPDVKRMLACSTMGQMGFMLVQCGMGLFAAAVSHLCWHGLFKAYLFLNAGSVVSEKRDNASKAPIRFTQMALAVLAGLAGAMAFSLVSGLNFDLSNTSCLMSVLAFMAATQLALELMRTLHGASALFAVPLASLAAGTLYGLNIRVIDWALESLSITQPQPLDAIYVIGFIAMALVWLMMNLKDSIQLQSRAAWKRVYVAALNGSQPHPQTLTAIRTTYQC